MIVKHWDELTPVEVDALARLRTEVFLREQGCTEEELDWRDLEASTEHYLLPAEEDAAPGETAGHPALAAYLRVLTDPDAEGDGLVIGRVVTDPAHRGKGLASRLLAAVIERHGDEPLLLHAQVYAAGLYAKAGFAPVGEEFDEAGIPHITMVRPA